VFSIGRRGITRASLGLEIGRKISALKEDLLLVLALAVIVTVPFAIGHHYWQTTLFHHAFRLRMPENFLIGVVTQVFVVALAEEIYFRGYLQERLRRIWPPVKTLFGVPFGKAILVSAAVFALAHFVGEYRPDRLGPFFPALVFGLLRERTGRIYAPILFHAYCNVLGEVLWACYRP
jgi:membrane protease YdiL (CAAX protease family)